MNIVSNRNRRCYRLLLVLACAAVANSADRPGVRAALRPANERKSAPEFALKDSSGKTITLANLRGKVVLVDFWATWCTGCKEEIPWFSEFQRRYKKEGLALVGISMDEGGWKVLKPFLAKAHIPYSIVWGDDRTAQGFGIQSLPDTFLIDREGRIAAAYIAGLVDRDDMDANIRALLSSR